MDTEDIVERDYLNEALDIVAGRASEPRTMLRLPEREHLIALDVYHTARKAISGCMCTPTAWPCDWCKMMNEEADATERI